MSTVQLIVCLKYSEKREKEEKKPKRRRFIMSTVDCVSQMGQTVTGNLNASVREPEVWRGR
jgi:hypothetical protein